MKTSSSDQLMITVYKKDLVTAILNLLIFNIMFIYIYTKTPLMFNAAFKFYLQSNISRYLYYYFHMHILDYLFKYLIIGSAGVGKSCILHQFMENKCKVSSMEIFL